MNVIVHWIGGGKILNLLDYAVCQAITLKS